MGAEVFAQAAYEIDRAMLAASTTNGNRQITATISNVMGQPLVNELGDVGFHAHDFWNFFQKFLNGLVIAGQAGRVTMIVLVLMLAIGTQTLASLLHLRSAQRYWFGW